MSRTRADLCPGVLRPWPADDGALVRLRLIGGRVSHASLRALVEVAEEYGDGRVRVTGRANLQLRGLPSASGALPPEVVAAIEATGLLPTRTHELVRNIMASPGLVTVAAGLVTVAAGLVTVAARPPRPPQAPRAPLDSVLDDLDRLLCADPTVADLPGRFLFVLDDGSGTLVDRSCDLGLVALSATEAQLRVGEGWGAVVPLDEAAARLAALAADFVRARGDGPSAPWHVRELDAALAPPVEPDPRLPEPSGPMPYDERHLAVPDAGLDRAAVEALPEGPLIVTPWRGLLLPAPIAQETA